MQKFKRGNLVRVADDLGPSMSHFRAGADAVVLGSYDDQYGGGNTDSYTLMFMDDGNSVSWYYEHQLTLLDEGGPDMIAKATANRERNDDLHSDLEWIVKNWPDIRTKVPGTTMATLMHMIGIHHPWGSNGEGINYYMNARFTFEVLDPVLREGSVERLKEAAEAIKRCT